MMKKRIVVMCCIAFILLMTGCAEQLDSLEYYGDSGFYSNYSAGGGWDDYELSGKAYVSDILPCLYVTSSGTSEITITGKLKEISGTVEIVYVSEHDEKVIVSTEDTKKNIDTVLRLENGDGRIDFRGKNINLNFDLLIENIDRGNVKYLSSERKYKENSIGDIRPAAASSSDPNLNPEDQNEMFQEITVSYTNNDSDCIVLNTEITEDTKRKVSVCTSVSTADDSKSTSFNGFELMYKTEKGETIEVIRINQNAFALGGYEWQSNISTEVTLPKGTNELIFRNDKGSNYNIVLDICVFENFK